MEGCPHCGKAVFRLSPDGLKLKAPTTCLVIHKSGEVEINCPKCKLGVLVPLATAGTLELRKAKPHQKHVLKKA